MEATRDMIIAALVALLVAGWLVAGRIGFGIALALVAVLTGLYALLREVDPEAEARARERARRHRMTS